MRFGRRVQSPVEGMLSRAAIEAGVGVDPTRTGKAAVIAHFSAVPRVSRSVEEIVRQLTALGYICILVSTSPAVGTLTWPNGLPGDTIVVRRTNEGYDFGSWAVGLAMFPEMRRLDLVILTNDSMAGPFAPIDGFVDAFENSPVEVWAITDSHQISHHLQSYFIGFRGGVLDDRPWRTFFGGIEDLDEKMDIVLRYEFGIMRTCRREAYSWNALYKASDLGVGLQNPTLAGWRKLIALGYPFLKRTIVADPSTAPDGDQVERIVRRRFGVELAQWL